MRPILIVILLLLTGCGTESPEPSVPAEPTTPSSSTGPPAARSDSTVPEAKATVPAEFEGTIAITEHPPDTSTTRPIVLQAVRTAAHPGFDRVVFEFDASALPGYHIEYVDKPVRQCGSGNPVVLAGDGWLEVRMSPAYAHTEAGEPTISEREHVPDLPVLRELESTCDFEAVVTWVLGVASPNAYRVLELADPPRLAVDVRH